MYSYTISNEPDNGTKTKAQSFGVRNIRPWAEALTCGLGPLLAPELRSKLCNTLPKAAGQGTKKGISEIDPKCPKSFIEKEKSGILRLPIFGLSDKT